MADNKVNSGLLEFSEDQKVFVALDAETSEVKKAVLLNRQGDETALGALPTDEQVQSAVDAWLVDHPEATTTVQDGAITTAKLADDTVTSDKLADDSVTDDKLADGSVTDDKLAPDGIKAEVNRLKSELKPSVSISAKEMSGGVAVRPCVRVPDPYFGNYIEEWNYLADNKYYTRFEMCVPEEYGERWIGKVIIAANVEYDENFVLTEETKTTESIRHQLNNQTLDLFFSLTINPANITLGNMTVIRGEIEIYDESKTNVIQRIYSNQVVFAQTENGVAITEQFIEDYANAVVEAYYLLLTDHQTVLGNSEIKDSSNPTFPLVYGVTGSGDSFSALYGLGGYIPYEEISEPCNIVPVIKMGDGAIITGNAYYFKQEA